MSVNLRAERANKGKSAEDAAAEIGVSKQVLLNAEKGSRPHAQNAYRIAKYYGFQVTDVWPVILPAEVTA